jgi:plasmid stabilization system protein ParE
MNIEILPGAREDLAAGYRFYEKQSPGLGNYFYETLFADIESLRENAGIHPVIYGSHRALSRRFPYGIYYEIKGDTVRVQAVYDCRRHPARIRRRLKDE